MTNDQIKNTVVELLGDNADAPRYIKKLNVTHRNGKIWVSVHLTYDKSVELWNCFSRLQKKLYNTFGNAFQNYHHQHGNINRLSFSLRIDK